MLSLGKKSARACLRAAWDCRSLCSALIPSFFQRLGDTFVEIHHAFLAGLLRRVHADPPTRSEIAPEKDRKPNRHLNSPYPPLRSIVPSACGCTGTRALRFPSVQPAFRVPLQQVFLADVLQATWKTCPDLVVRSI